MKIFKFLKEAWYAMMNMFKVDGNLSIDTSNVYVNGTKADLSLCSIADVDYFKLVAEGKCQNDVIYVVSSSNINAYGQQIKNLASPTDLSDAATKEYVDKMVSQVSTDYLTKDEVAQISKDVFRSCLSGILSVM